MADLAERYRNVRARSLELAAPLSPEDCGAQSMPDASPVKWHLAHTTWFFEIFVAGRLDASAPSFEAAYRYLFNSYYNSVGAQYSRSQRGLLTRPGLDEVLAYRAHVDKHVEAAIAAGRVEDAGLDPVIELGLHHEQQHQELILTDVKHLLSCNPMHPAYRSDLESPDDAAVPELKWHGVEEGVHHIGHAGDGFAFDNECPRHRVFCEAFEIASRPVTSGEYLEFMRDGGYETPTLWLAEGWAALQERGWDSPLYWQRNDDGWMQMTLGGLREVDPAEPVCHVSLFEADAFAHWAGARLPDEAEWELVASEVPIEGCFADDDYLHPTPAPARAGSGPFQLFGDVWEWTRSAYTPYPGFAPLEGGLGEYNGKFMSSQNVLRGGSCATPAGHVRPTYRNFFYPADRWQFSGLRLARDLASAG